MNALRIALIIIIPTLQTILLNVGIAMPTIYFGILIATLMLSDVLITFFFKSGTKKKQILVTAFPSVALLLFISTALALVESQELRIVFLTLNAFLQFVYAMTIYFALHRPHLFQEQSLLHTTLTVHSAAYFALCVTFFGLLYFSVAPFRILIVPFILITMIFSYHLSIIFIKTIRDQWRFIAVSTLILSEFAFLIYWLPNVYISKAFIMTIPHYFLSIMTLNLHNTLRGRRQILVPFFIGIIVLFLVLLTFRWR